MKFLIRISLLLFLLTSFSPCILYFFRSYHQFPPLLTCEFYHLAKDVDWSEGVRLLQGFARKSKTLQEHSDTAKKQGCFVSIITLKTTNLKGIWKDFHNACFFICKNRKYN